MDTTQAKELRARRKINWGRGRLRRYQSFVSFAATFCALNGLSATKFVRFWNEIFEPLKVNEKIYQKQVSLFLDEPLRVVKTVFMVEIPPVAYELDARGQLKQGSPIQYCIDCLKEGLHASFHEDFLLGKCLLHNLPLTPLRDSHSQCRRLEERIVRVKALHAATDSAWPTGQTNSIMRSETGGFSLAKTYLEWRKEAEGALHVLTENAFKYSNDQWGVYADTYAYFHRDLSLLLGRVAWSAPLPNQLNGFLAVAPSASQQPEVKNYGKGAADELNELLKVSSLNTLLWLYRVRNLIKQDCRPYQKTVKSAITELSRHKCQCEWGLLHGVWIRFLNGAISDYTAQCPYEISVEELESRWLTLFPGFPRDPSEAYSYDRTVEKYKIAGAVSLVGCSTDHGPFSLPWLELNMSDQLIRFLEDVLERFAQIQAAELVHWAETINGRTRVPERETLPPSIYIEQNADGELQLVSWPPEERRT